MASDFPVFALQKRPAVFKKAEDLSRNGVAYYFKKMCRPGGVLEAEN